MSNRPHVPDEEPVIGFTEQPGEPGYEDGAVIGDGDPAAFPRLPYEDTYEGEYYGEEDLEPYFATYADESPTRNPWFYAFLATAALIGAVVVFFVIRAIGGEGDGEAATPVPAQILQVALVSPRDGDRVMAGQEVTFAANVASSDPITRVELFVDDRPYAEGGAALAATTSTPAATASARLYEATVRTTFAERGDHKAVLRVTSGNLVRDTAAIRIVVVEPPQDPRVEARILATTSLRTGPGDAFPEVGRLQPGTRVMIAAKTRDGEWLLLDDDSPGERWIRRNAVQEDASLVNVPIRDVTATPPPTSTPTPESTATPTPTGAEPDFAPIDARFVFGAGGRGALRVSITNTGADFSGPLVVEAATSDGTLVSPKIVFDLSLRSGRVATVDFEIAGPLPERADVTVRIDPENAIRESNEDNNTVTFTGVTAPSDPPEIVIESLSVDGATITVVVHNIGGPMQPSEITVRVSVAGSQASQSTTASLDSDQRIQFTIQAPATGTGTVQVLVNGATAATRTVEVGGGEATSTAAPGG
jgi:uncharacterized protein YraI